MKKLGRFGLVLVSLVCSLVGRSAAEPVVIDRVAASVNGEAITTSEVARDVELLRTHGGASLGRTDLYRMALDERIERAILRKRLSAMGVKVTDEEVEGAIGDVARQANLPREKIGILLEKEGVTLDEYKDRLRDQIAKSKIIGMEIRPRLVVDDAKVKAYYDAHPEEFARPESAHLADIFFPVPPDAPPSAQDEAMKKAQKALERVRAGEAFEAVAKEMSGGPTAKDGGDIGTFKSGELVGNLEKTASALGVGEVSEPVTAAGGVHILKLIDRVDAGPKPLGDVAEKIRDKLAAPELAKKYEEWLSKQKNEMFVEVLVKPEEMAGVKQGETQPSEERLEEGASVKPAEKETEPESPGADEGAQGQEGAPEPAKDATTTELLGAEPVAREAEGTP